MVVASIIEGDFQIKNIFLKGRKFMTELLNWLLEDNNAAIKYRTQTELLGLCVDSSDAKHWAFSKLPENWYEANGLWYRYYITALAECGLSSLDIPKEYINKAFHELEKTFDCGCGDFMLLTSLMKLGFSNHEVIRNIIGTLNTINFPDGGFLCLHRANKLNYTPKSCYKASLHALMFLAECHKNGINTDFEQSLIDYFFNRNIFYKSTDKTSLVLPNREGWQTIDVFYPFEVMRVGLQNVVESFSAIGYGNDKRLQEAWSILDNQKDEAGRVILKGTLTKSYLPKERVGKPSKWATFYTLLAETERSK